MCTAYIQYYTVLIYIVLLHNVLRRKIWKIYFLLTLSFAITKSKNYSIFQNRINLFFTQNSQNMQYCVLQLNYSNGHGHQISRNCVWRSIPL